MQASHPSSRTPRRCAPCSCTSKCIYAYMPMLYVICYMHICIYAYIICLCLCAYVICLCAYIICLCAYVICLCAYVPMLYAYMPMLSSKTLRHCAPCSCTSKTHGYDTHPHTIILSYYYHTIILPYYHTTILYARVQVRHMDMTYDI
jgi:hypothetical protein